MNGAEVYEVLIEKGVYRLHHANTVTTSCSFFLLGGLASRGCVADNRMPQTPQYTDRLDQRLGIWYDVFLDGIDLHARGRIRNNYGPVLFMLPTDLLLNLPVGTEVNVARKNPSNWVSGESDADRYFMSQDELRDGYIYGEFGQHIILTTDDGILPFNQGQIDILLDNPQCQLRDGNDAYTSAVRRLQGSAAANGININITMRRCRQDCRCLTGHRLSYDQTDINNWF